MGGAVGNEGARRGGGHRLRGLRGVGVGAGIAFAEGALVGVQQRQVVVGFGAPPRGERATVFRRPGRLVGFPQRLQPLRGFRVRPPLPTPPVACGVAHVQRHHPLGDELLDRRELRVDALLTVLAFLRHRCFLRDGLSARLGAVLAVGARLESGVLRVHRPRRIEVIAGCVHLVVQAHRAVTDSPSAGSAVGRGRWA